MTGEGRLDSWQATERDLRAALAASNVEGGLALQIEEYLDHNELGLAFEDLVVELDQRQLAVPAEVLPPLSSAIDRMGRSSFGPETISAWERVRSASPG